MRGTRIFCFNEILFDMITMQDICHQYFNVCQHCALKYKLCIATQEAEKELTPISFYSYIVIVLHPHTASDGVYYCASYISIPPYVKTESQWQLKRLAREHIGKLYGILSAQTLTDVIMQRLHSSLRYNNLFVIKINCMVNKLQNNGLKKRTNRSII